MSFLERPIKRTLARKLDDARLASVWRRVRDERLQARPRRRRLVFAAVPLTLVAVALLVWLRVPATTAPLKLADASPLSAIATTQQPRTVDLDDGSHITLSPGGLLQTVANRDRVFGTKLVHGRAEFEVRPGGPRRWLVHAGGVTVEVVGTHFTVDRAAHSVAVAVSRGEVLVRGKGVVGGAQSLRVGQSLQVADDDESSGDAATAATATATAATAIETAATTADHPASAPADILQPPAPPLAYRRNTVERIAGADPHLPDAVKRRLRGQPDHSFSAQICIGTDGAVADVSVLQGIAGADESLLATLRQWKYTPQSVPVCFVTQLVFSVE